VNRATRQTAKHSLQRAGRIARAVVPVVLLAALVTRLGTDPFQRSLQVLTPLPIVAALLLGAVTTTAQALRWRTVAQAYGSAAGLTRGRAIAEYYRSGLLNSVLPGGVLGDAVRIWRQRPTSGPGFRPRATALGSSARAAIVERVIGTMLLLLAVAVVTVPIEWWVSGLMLTGAGIAAVIAVPGLVRLPVQDRLPVLGWSVLSLVSLVIKFAVAAAALGTVHDPVDVVTLALIALAGMSVPFGIGGFGPREAVAAVAFAAIGLSADAGVATSAAYGVLAAVSTAPGALIMLLDVRHQLDLRHQRETPCPLDVLPGDPLHPPLVSSGVLAPGGGQIEFEADVRTEDEPAGRRA
jgi:uncharacterized membrane protein YbhN (UPF0104 family)